MSYAPKIEEYQEIREALGKAIDDECRMSAHLEHLTHRDPKGLERLREIRKRIDDLESLLATSASAPTGSSILEASPETPEPKSAQHSPPTQRSIDTLPKLEHPQSARSNATQKQIST